MKDAIDIAELIEAHRAGRPIRRPGEPRFGRPWQPVPPGWLEILTPDGVRSAPATPEALLISQRLKGGRK